MLRGHRHLVSVSVSVSVSVRVRVRVRVRFRVRVRVRVGSCSVATGTWRSFAFKAGSENASRSARTLAALARRIACIEPWMDIHLHARPLRTVG